jgi:vesicle coat complex subunit
MDQTLSNQQLIELLGSQDRGEQYEAYKALFTQGQAMLDDAMRGLKHENAKVRRACADLMDHLADDRCVLPLVELLNDDVPRVRRQAVHSLACQRCKPSPLQADLTDTLIAIALNDPNLKVRGEAVFGLSYRPPDARIVAALERIIQVFEQVQPPLTKAQRSLLRSARWSLKHQRFGLARLSTTQAQRK